MWVRGLKHCSSKLCPYIHLSHPMWVRGLKRGNGYNDQGHLHVAPHVGAWIETSFSQSYLDERESHPMWVRGLKLATRHV